MALLQQYFCLTLVTLGDWAWTILEQGLHNSIVVLHFARADAASSFAHAIPCGQAMQVLSCQEGLHSCDSARRKSYTSSYPLCACQK